MKYALIKNVPLTHLLGRSGGKINWGKYGFTIDGLRGVKDFSNNCCGQGWTAQQVKGEVNGDYLNILPITDQEAFDKMLPSMVAYCENSSNPNDSVTVLTEDEAMVEAAKIVVQEEPTA